MCVILFFQQLSTGSLRQKKIRKKNDGKKLQILLYKVAHHNHISLKYLNHQIFSFVT